MVIVAGVLSFMIYHEPGDLPTKTLASIGMIAMIVMGINLFRSSTDTDKDVSE
jgi:hypothetical protein